VGGPFLPGDLCIVAGALWARPRLTIELLSSTRDFIASTFQERPGIVVATTGLPFQPDILVTDVDGRTGWACSCETRRL